MIKLAYLGESKKIEFKDEDVKFFIVRRPVNGIPFGFIHMPTLSPSQELFNDTKRWKNNQYTNKEKEFLRSTKVPITSDSWWLLYEPRFKQELQSKESEKILEGIKDISKEGNIWLFCYCKDIDRCHRKIVAEALVKLGCSVDYRRKETEKEKYNQVTFFDDY